MNIVNLTPHAITVLGDDGAVIAEFPPSGVIARCAETVIPDGEVAGNTVVKITNGETTGLPDAGDDTIYVVSLLVCAGNPDRGDLYIPALLDRDELGRVIGCRAFAQNPHYARHNASQKGE